MSRVDRDFWHTISPLLDRALDLEGDGQTAFLEELRRDSPELARALEGLLDDHHKLDESDFLGASPTPQRAARTLAGQTVGAYTLDAPLGVGGMGTVWRAHRSDGQFEGDVAVKLLHLGLTDGRGIERFKREGTLLARLTHPNIARLLDAGVTDMGRSYLVLEYIQGTRIDEFANAHQLDPRERLNLFLQVTDAVAYAHARLVVHRDLKPSNILVDASGRIKLLDFGIAKLLEDQGDGDRAEQTAFSTQALTPAYAAPEQARGDAVTTATDVYALGVLLYVLLTGRHPTSPDSRESAEHLRRVIDEEPTRASVAATITTDEADDAVRRAKLRRSSPERLRRLYRGDLDNILTAALEKEPTARYATITAFADDVRRYVNNEPISVRTDAWAYRTRKFLRRHTAGVVVTGVIAAILVTATVVSTRLMFEAQRQRDEARYQERRSSAQSDFMRNMVTTIGNKPMTMKEVLDRGRAALEQQYADDPAFVARMLTILSGPYVELGDRATSHAMMQRVLEIATQLDDPRLLAEAHCGNADDLTDMRDYTRAREHLDEAQRQIARMQPPQTGVQVSCAIAESQLAMGQERFDDSVMHMERAVAFLEREGNTGTTRYTTAVNALARAYWSVGRIRDALAGQRKVMEVSHRIGRSRTISMVTSYNNVGSYEELLGWWLEAERSFKDGVELARGLRSSAAIPGYITSNYGRLLILLGRTPEGIEWLQRTIDEPKQEARFRNRSRLWLAAAMFDRGDVAAARAAFEQAERDMTRPTPSERVDLIVVRARLAVADGRLDEARAMVREGLRAGGYPARASEIVHPLLNHGALLAIQANDRDEALRLAHDGLSACERHFGTDKPSAHVGRARLTLGLALRAAERPADARSQFEQAATIIAAAAGGDHPWVREARQALAATPQ